MSSALQFVRTPSGLTILLGCKPYTVASVDAIFPAVLSLIQANASEADVLDVIELGKSASQQPAPVLAVDEQGGDTDEPVLVLTTLAIRGGYAGQSKDGEFEVFGDGEYLASFDSGDSAAHYGEIIQHRFDTVVVRDGLGKAILALGDTSHVVMSGGLPTSDADTSEQDEIDELADGDDDEEYYRVCNDAGEQLESFSDEDEAMEYAQKQANEYGCQVIIQNNSGDFLNAVDPEASNEEPVFEVFGDGSYLDQFSTQSLAVAHAESQRSRYRKLKVVETHSQADDFPVASITGFLGTFQVTADGQDKGRFDSQPQAKAEAIYLFGSDQYGRVVVLDADESELVVLEN